MEKDKLIIGKPRQYADQAKNKGSQYYDYDNHVNLQWSQGSNYLCERKIGRGKYSQVFESINALNSQKCVVKMLKPIKMRKINRQIKILRSLNGQNNCVKLLDIVKQGEVHCLVFQHVAATDYRKLLPLLKPEDCRYYLYQILIGLDYCHSKGIMHRDIKPGNVMIDHETRKLRIIDWGLGQFYLPQQDYNVRVSSRYFKGPQLLVNYEYYHYSLDIWSLGVMMAGMIFQKDPFFKGSDNFDQLQQITKVLGREQLHDYLQKYNIVLDQKLQRILGTHKSIKLHNLINQSNKHLTTPDAIDLITKMLQYDHSQRPTAKQCMSHPYFREIHKKEELSKPKGK